VIVGVTAGEKEREACQVLAIRARVEVEIEAPIVTTVSARVGAAWNESENEVGIEAESEAVSAARRFNRA